MPTSTAVPSDFIATFSRQRQQLLQRAGNAFEPSDVERMNPVVSQCLVTSLEELKVAEEEMLDQQMRMLTTQAESERQIKYFRTLFDLAPVPLLLTTSDGVIRAANNAMGEMLTRDVYHLEGKPMPALVSVEQRQGFRTQLARVAQVGGVTDWAITLDRQTRGPLDVVATITLVPSALTGTMALYWSFSDRAAR